MRIFKNNYFAKWAEFEKVTDELLKKAVEEMNDGLYEANLSGGLYKKRTARKGQGKRGGYRTIIAYKRGSRAIFMYAFSKNDRENIKSHEKDVYKMLAKYYLLATDEQLDVLVKNSELFEV